MLAGGLLTRYVGEEEVLLHEVDRGVAIPAPRIGLDDAAGAPGEAFVG
jgi:hypothetical protein